MSWIWIGAGVVAVLAAYFGWTFNRLVALNRRADGAWSDIDVQLKRRWDLVPSLVAAVKGYAAHESSTLESVVEARSRAAGSVSANPEARGQNERGLAVAVTKIFALAEAYPDLKANQGFLDLQKTLTEIEDNVQYARRYYNAVIRDLNTLVQSIPSMFVASATGFKTRDFFQLDSDAERAAPQVKLS